MQWPRPTEARAACVEGGEVNDPQQLMARLKQIYRENPTFRAVNGERWGLSRGDRRQAQLTRKREERSRSHRVESHQHGQRPRAARHRRERRKGRLGTRLWGRWDSWRSYGKSREGRQGKSRGGGAQRGVGFGATGPGVPGGCRQVVHVCGQERFG